MWLTSHSRALLICINKPPTLWGMFVPLVLLLMVLLHLVFSFDLDRVLQLTQLTLD
jgi:hypothetical protein